MTQSQDEAYRKQFKYQTSITEKLSEIIEEISLTLGNKRKQLKVALCYEEGVENQVMKEKLLSLNVKANTEEETKEISVFDLFDGFEKSRCVV